MLTVDHGRVDAGESKNYGRSPEAYVLGFGISSDPARPVCISLSQSQRLCSKVSLRPSLSFSQLYFSC